METAFPTLLRDSASPLEQKEADEEDCPFSRTRACEAVANQTKVGAKGVREGIQYVAEAKLMNLKDEFTVSVRAKTHVDRLNPQPA